MEKWSFNGSIRAIMGTSGFWEEAKKALDCPKGELSKCQVCVCVCVHMYGRKFEAG